jgi:hypothetical protein
MNFANFSVSRNALILNIRTMPTDADKTQKMQELADTLSSYRKTLEEFRDLEKEILDEFMKVSETSSLDEARKNIESLMN